MKKLKIKKNKTAVIKRNGKVIFEKKAAKNLVIEAPDDVII